MWLRKAGKHNYKLFEINNRLYFISCYMHISFIANTPTFPIAYEFFLINYWYTNVSKHVLLIQFDIRKEFLFNLIFIKRFRLDAP